MYWFDLVYCILRFNVKNAMIKKSLYMTVVPQSRRHEPIDDDDDVVLQDIYDISLVSFYNYCVTNTVYYSFFFRYIAN